MRIACAQLNTVVGDLDGNLALVREAIRDATARGAHLVLTPELALTGYPPEDLLLRPSFAAASREALAALAGLNVAGAPASIANSNARSRPSISLS
jgi:NAD+ synthase (glutamine-hydrolysing)